jgi:hypothetical protein
MPRMSAEARGASVYQAGGEAPSVPSELTPQEAAIWREVVDSKPVDWFDGGSLGLLRQYCSTMAQARLVAEHLRTCSWEDAVYLEKRLTVLNTSCTMLATKLRISVQNKFDTRSGMLTEKKKKSDDNILGGNALWPGAGRLQAVS